MKSALIVVIVLTAAALITWVRGGETFPLPQAIPFCGGKSPSLTYDLLGGLGMVLLALWGLGRLTGGRNRQEEPEAVDVAEPEETLEDGSGDEDELEEVGEESPDEEY